MNINSLFSKVRFKQIIIKSLTLLLCGLGFTSSYAQICGPVANLTADRWTMVALPCAPITATVQGVFADDLNPADYDFRWVVYERDESVDSYNKLSLTSPLIQGAGYWILSLDAVSYDVDGISTPLTTANANCPSVDGCFEIILTPPDTVGSMRQNMVGHPFPFDVDWANVIVEVDGTGFTPSAAVAEGVSNIINKYNGNGYDPFNDVTPAMLGVLNPFDGFWIELLGASAGKTVKLLIPGGNLPPDAVDDAVTTDEDTVLNGDVLVANPTDPDSDLEGPLPLNPVTEVNGNAGDIGNAIVLSSGGQLTQNADGTFSYDPNGAFESLKASPDVPNEDTDTYDYTLIDSDGATDIGTVTVTITGVNDPPVAQDDMFMTPQDTAIMMADVMADNANGTDQDPEGDVTTVTQVNAAGFVSGIAFALPSGAMLSMQTNGIFSYDPNTLTTPPAAGSSVNDSFAYQLCDPGAACDTATVTIQVNSTVTNPVAQNITGTVDEDSAMNSIPISVTGGAATVSSVTQPANGTSNLSGTNVLYTPDLNYCNTQPGGSTDNFTYTITPGGSTANVNVTVTCINDKPVVTPPAAFAVTGNVKINGTGLLSSVSDVDGAGATPFFVGGTLPTTSTNGGDVLITNVNTGAFSYDPPPGHEGADSFSYQVCDNGFPAPSMCSDAATVNLSVADMIWFIDTTAGGGGDGRLSSPFNCLVGAGCFSPTAVDQAGDNIFIADGTYLTSGLTLLNNQKLIGDGSTSNLATITGITLAPDSMPLPIFSGTAPLISNGGSSLALAQGNTVRGLDLSNTGGTALIGNGFGSLTVAEVNVSNSGGTAVNLNNGNPTASFTSVSSTGGANGIILNGTTGSFSITGSGTTNGSGGTIQSNATGVSLTSASNVTLKNLNFPGTHTDFVIRGNTVNNLTLNNVRVTGTSGDSVVADEGGILLTGITGNLDVDGGVYGGGIEDNFAVSNSSGTVNATFDNVTFNANNTSTGDNNLQFRTSSSATGNLSINGSTFNGGRSVMTFTDIGGSGGGAINIGNTSANMFLQAQTNVVGGGAIEVLASGNNTVDTTISDNTIRANGSTFEGDVIVLGTTSGFAGTHDITVTNNTIGTSGVNGSAVNPASGSGDAGLVISQNGTGTITSLINSNMIFDFNSSGIEVFFDAEGAPSPPTGGTLNSTISNNTVTDAIGGNNASIEFIGDDRVNTCIDITGNTLNNPADREITIDVFGESGTTFRVPGLTTLTEAGIESRWSSINGVLIPTTDVRVFSLSPSTIAGGGACPLP